MYAIIKTGGKQYRVQQGDEFKVEKLDAEVGDKVVFDQVGTPTYALDLAKAIAVIVDDYKQETLQGSPLTAASQLLTSDLSRLTSRSSTINPASPFAYSKSGIYHYSNEGVCSWYDFTKMIAQYNGTTACDVQPCHSDEFPSPVKRPSYSVLDKTKIKTTFGVEVPYWTDSLRRCIEALNV